jgi:uncharacterized oxidoreductase
MIIQGKRAIITGGSSGIGFATARELLVRGAHVVVTGRRTANVAEAVEQLQAFGRVDGVVADAATEEGRQTTLREATAKLGGLDMLVNNAGAVRAGRLEDVTSAEIEAMITVNLLAPIMLARAALPALRASGDGLIVNVTSAIGLVGTPFYATYSAVKAGLARFGESLRRELKGEGVSVLTVYPVGTDTPMMATNRSGNPLESADEVARAIADGIEKNAFEIIRGGEARAKLIALNREDPEAVDRIFLERKSALAEASREHSAL